MSRALRRPILILPAVFLAAAGCGASEPVAATPADPEPRTQNPSSTEAPPEPLRPDPGFGPAPPPPPDPRIEEARRRFEEGVRRFEEGNPAAAVNEFRAAYTLEPRSAVLFNIATCQEHLGDLQGALDTYKRYLATSGGEMPDHLRRTVLDKVHALERSLGLRP